MLRELRAENYLDRGARSELRRRLARSHAEGAQARRRCRIRIVATKDAQLIRRYSTSPILAGRSSCRRPINSRSITRCALRDRAVRAARTRRRDRRDKRAAPRVPAAKVEAVIVDAVRRHIGHDAPIDDTVRRGHREAAEYQGPSLAIRRRIARTVLVTIPITAPLDGALACACVG
jgi:hypothetical protein